MLKIVYFDRMPRASEMGAKKMLDLVFKNYGYQLMRVFAWIVCAALSFTMINDSIQVSFS